MIRKLIKQLVRTFIPADSDLDFWIYTSFRWKPPKGSIEEAINKYSKKNQGLFFMQVGSNDGRSGDPLYKFIRRDAWQGVLIEPVDYLFKQLKENYRGLNTKGITFENAAIANHNGYEDFYYFKDFIPDENKPITLNQQGSFSKEHIDSVKVLFPEAEIAVKKVVCKTVASVLSEHNISRLNLLHLDTEGYDFEIIKSIDFDAVRPDLILYEHIHLNEQDKVDCQNLLKSHQYQIFRPNEGYDTLAYLPQAVNLNQ
jgi:FkbM family methyltransferase